MSASVSRLPTPRRELETSFPSLIQHLVGDIPHLRAEIPIDDGIIRQFSQITGDINPIHLDEASARARGFPRRVVHSTLLMALMGGLLSRYYANGVFMLRESGVQVKNPLYVGQTAQFLFLQNKKWSRRLSTPQGLIAGDYVFLTARISCAESGERFAEIDEVVLFVPSV